nr:GAS2-like protein 2 [Loxodonta africana]
MDLGRPGLPSLSVRSPPGKGTRAFPTFRPSAACAQPFPRRTMQAGGSRRGRPTGISRTRILVDLLPSLHSGKCPRAHVKQPQAFGGVGIHLAHRNENEFGGQEYPSTHHPWCGTGDYCGTGFLSSPPPTFVLGEAQELRSLGALTPTPSALPLLPLARPRCGGSPGPAIGGGVSSPQERLSQGAAGGDWERHRVGASSTLPPSPRHGAVVVFSGRRPPRTSTATERAQLVAFRWQEPGLAPQSQPPRRGLRGESARRRLGQCSLGRRTLPRGPRPGAGRPNAEPPAPSRRPHLPEAPAGERGRPRGPKARSTEGCGRGRRLVAAWDRRPGAGAPTSSTCHVQARGSGGGPGSGPPVRSIRPFKSSEQYLEAMKEDLAEWLQDLYGLDIDGANFLQVLETGLVLCQHANTVTEAALAFLAEAPAQAQRIPMPRAGVSCNEAAQPGTFQARDNVSNFIQWCRKEMGIQGNHPRLLPSFPWALIFPQDCRVTECPVRAHSWQLASPTHSPGRPAGAHAASSPAPPEVLMFKTEDLRLPKSVKNLSQILLVEGAERPVWEGTWSLGRGKAEPIPFSPQVQSLVSHCTCPVQFSMVKVSEGKYRVGDSNTLIFIRILRNHVMVRVGGGWDTLGHYLDKHDPCRCTSLSHKPGSLLKPPAPPVQHEVRVQDGPLQPQPTMTISRSQSPLPPVDWKTYTSSGRKLRPPPSSSPSPCSERGAGMGILREMAAPLRCQERSLTPSQRQLPAGDSLSSPRSSSTHRGQDSQCVSSGKREDRHPSELLRGRTLTSWVHEETDSRGTHGRAPTPQRLQAPEVTTKRTPARGPSPLPRSSSPVKNLSLRQPPRGKVKGASPQLRESAIDHSPSPVKGPTKIPTRLPPARPPTPGRSFPGTESGAPMTELERGPIPLRAVAGDRHPAVSSHGNCVVGTGEGDQKLDLQAAAEAREPWGKAPQEQEGRYTPLPLGRTKQQATYHSLEEEILANMKLLEAGGARPLGTRSGTIPRSGVYVPSLGGRWPEPTDPYDKVIQELTQGPPPLIKVDMGAWGAAPTGSRKSAVTPDPGSPKGKLGVRDNGPRTKATLSANGTGMRKVPSQGGQDCSALTVSASPEVPILLPLDPNSDQAKACPNKGKRTLRKPQRVPSIYKLKLRPRIRPRRDHRPEKQPSRIPKPLAYLHLGPARAPSRCRLSKAALGIKGEEAPPVDGAFEGGKEEEGMEKKESATILESSLPPPEDLRPQQLDQTLRPPEEESWV